VKSAIGTVIIFFLY